MNVRSIKPAIKTAALLSLRLLHLCRGDNTGVRYRIPHFLLRLGRNQLAYDFIRFWGMRVDDPDDLSQPYLNFWQSDLSEGEGWEEEPLGLPHLVGMLLIKLRYLENCLQRQKFQIGFLPVYKLGGVVAAVVDNSAVIRHIYEYLIAPGTFFARSHIQPEDIEAQIKSLIAKVESANSIMCRALVNPQPLLALGIPCTYSRNSPEEAFITLTEALPSWHLTPFALNFLHRYCCEKYDDLQYQVVRNPRCSYK